MKVTIQNLTINIGHRTAEPTNLLESLLRNATLVPFDDELEDNQDTTCETDTQQAPLTQDELVERAKVQIVEFLQPTDQFSQRTWSTLHKAVSVNHGVTTGVLPLALSQLVSDGIVQTKRRRADGETLYSTSVGAYVAVPPRQDQPETETTEVPQMVCITVSDLVEFLKSDDRYEFRSFDAIRRHFDGWSTEDVQSLLAIAQSTDDVIRRTRSDGTSVYKAV